MRKRLLPLKEASEIYSLSLSTLYKLSAKRELGGLLKIGAKVLLDIEEFEIWLRSHRVDNGGKKK